MFHPHYWRHFCVPSSDFIRFFGLNLVKQYELAISKDAKTWLMIYLRKPVNVLFQQPPNYILRIYEVFILKKFSVEQIRESLRENRTSHLHLLMRFLLCFKFSFGTFIFNLENHFLIFRRWNISSMEE